MAQRPTPSPPPSLPDSSGWAFLWRPGRRRFILENKDTQFNEAWLALALLLIGAGLLLRQGFLTGAGLGLVVLVGAAWLWSYWSLAGLDYRRHFQERRAFVGERIRITLEVRNRKPLPLTWLAVRDVFPAALPVSKAPVILNQATNQAEFRTFWMPGAFQTLRREFEIQCVARGFHRFGPARLETGDGFGFFSRQVRLPQEEYLIVYPRLYPVEALGLPAHSPFGSQQVASPLFEDPLRPAGVREWQEGDSPRRVHWKATARHRRLLSRVYEPSREVQILVVLNVATLARPWHGSIPELLERAVSVAGSLAAWATERRLPVGLLANGTLPGSDRPLRLMPGRSPRQLVRILELLAAVTSFAAQPIEQLLLQEAPRLPWGTTVMVVTAVTHPELLAVLSELAQAGRPVTLFTLAERPPQVPSSGFQVYHLPHRVADGVAPARV